MKALRADIWLGIVVIAAATVYLVMDWRLPSARIGDPLGPKAFPALVGGGLILSAVLLFFETRKKRRARAEIPEAPQSEIGKNCVPVLIAMVVWTGLYYFCFERLGYPTATPLFIFGLLSYFNRRRHLLNLAIAVGFTAVIYLLFSVLLGVPLPLGPFES